MRDTDYATELRFGSVRFPNGAEGRIERLRFKQAPYAGMEGVRFSWWKEGRMIPRPLDGTEDEFLLLIKEAVRQGVFSEHFLGTLRELLVGDATVDGHGQQGRSS